MLTFPPVRAQGDLLNDEASEAAGLTTAADDDEFAARQEDKDETDINVMLRRFGVEGVVRSQRPATYGEVDYTIDLQSALHSVQEARTMFDRLPPELKKKYGTWQNVLNAAESGELQADVDQGKELERAARREAAIAEIDERDAIAQERARRQKRDAFEKRIDDPEPSPKSDTRTEQ